MSVFQVKNTIRVITAKYLGPTTADEIIKLGYDIIKTETAAVELMGTIEDCIRLNIYLRSAFRILFLIDEFEAEKPDDLKAHIQTLPWEDYIPRTGYFSVTSYVQNTHIRDTRFGNLIVKDAIVDRFMSKYNERPDSGSQNDEVVLFLFWRDSDAAIFIDTSGQTIAKHGYRDQPMFAPLQESLAAALLLMIGYDGSVPLINPMCGSGTLAIEGALIARNIAPGLMRFNYCFMHLVDFDQKVYAKIRQEAESRTLRNSLFEIIATDNHRGALKAASDNAREAKTNRSIKFIESDFTETPMMDGEGLIVINPPYGIRLGEDTDELNLLYKGIGDWLKQKGTGKRAGVLSANPEAVKQIGLKSTLKIPVMNADIECRWMIYDMYSGTKRLPRIQQDNLEGTDIITD